uniref:cytoskeleton-associated protein 5-like n=1 Tax=Styela clava TaxID=7725 RepID=UPI0019399F48|nr:cytoskeleton-associated protein 5-like [Styela clava]
MAEEDEWKKLSTEQKVQHKAWKARAEGYKECIRNFKMWDETSPEFNKYLGLMRKFVTDSNELIRIQGLEAALVFVENANVAKKTCGEVIPGIILKCFNSKPRMKEAGINLCLMYIEIDKNELTQEELVKGFSNKQPKVATACLEAVTIAISLFGSKVMQVKPILKEIPGLADHRDKNVREAVKALAVEIYKWVGSAIKASLQNINPVMLKELEEEWTKAEASGRSTQTRFMRSQQDLKEKMEAKQAAVSAGGDAGNEGGAVEEEQPEVDPYDLLDPVEILSELPKNFYEQIEAKKWQERKEMLELCQKLCENPKIENGDYGDLVKVLKKVVSKDTNVMLVTIAAKCLAGLAKGIRKKFHPFANVCTDAILEKFKEKKPNVVAGLQEAIDAIYMSTNLQGISETCIEYLNSKNPAIKEQTGLFLARAFSKTKPSALTKGTIKPIIQALLKNIDHSAPNVRDGSYKALGALLKLVSEKMVMPFLADLDNLKMEKIKEYSGKAEVQPKGAAAPKQTKPTQPQNAGASASTETAADKVNDPKKKVVKGGKKKPKPNKNVASSESSRPAEEPVLSEIAVEDQIAEFLSAEVIAQLSNLNWKERLEGLQNITQKLKLADVKTIPCQALVKTLGSGKQGWKDLNFNCLNEKFAIVKNLAENAKFSKTSGDICLTGLTDKIGDVKCGKASKEAITAIAEATSFAWVSETLLEYAISHKNPKIQSESLNWLSNAIKEFGIAGANVKMFIAKIKIGFAATNPAVRTAAFSVMSAMTLYIGAKIRMFFESEKPALLQQIDAEIEKCKGESPPAPIRGKSSKVSADSEEEEDEEDAPKEIKFDDLVTRVNIADKITDSLITKLADKNWKMRKEALEEVKDILNEAKFIEPTIGELAPAMKLRLADSNKILVTTALAILSQLSTSLGPHCKVHVKTIAPGLVGVLADSKPNVRQAGLNTMNQWSENTNLSLWFEDEIMSDALSVQKHTFLRIELLNWLTEKLLSTPKITASAKDGLQACVKHLYSCCEDRTGDVRAKAQAALPAFIYHLGMDKMTRFCGKLSPASLSTIQGLLEKAKDLVPARKSKQPNKAAKPVAVEVEIEIPPTVVQEENKPAKTASAKAKASKPGKRAPSSKKQQDDGDFGPVLIKIPNGKEQRMKDEQKLRTLKWIFDAPRDEIVVQLKTQMTPCVGSGLFAELFHADFQHHLKALNLLTQALENQWDETVGMLDLILRWLTLRFYEKNTTVHMKCLEYVKSVFVKLDSFDLRITDYEAYAFIPHLITKIGETKENIRKDVHAIMHQITKVYPAGKVFSHLMQGLVTKNSRQITECLDEIGHLITTIGIDVCQPTPTKALREVASHISNRDNSVRSAALNVLVCAYNTCGDVVYKFVGKLNEKNMSMLEERIKRSGKFSNEPLQAPAKVEAKVLKLPSKQAVPDKPKIYTGDTSSLTKKEHDIAEISDIDESDFKLPELLDTNCDDLLNEPDVEIPPRFVSGIHDFRASRSSENIDSTLNIIISSLASSDIDTCLKSIHQLDEVMKSTEKRELLKPRVDQILTSSCIQFRMAATRFFNDIPVESNDRDKAILGIVSLYKSLLSIDITIFKTPVLAVCATQSCLQDFIQAVVVFMIDKRVEGLPNGVRIIAILNILLADLLANANPTSVLCALLRLLHCSLENAWTVQMDLYKKCIWKVIYLMKDFISPASNSPRPILQPSIVLADLHQIQLAFTSKQLLPISKTFKSLVLAFCQILGLGVLDEVQNIVGIESSDLLQVITKCLKGNHPTSAIESHPVKSKSSSEIHKKENLGVSNGNLTPEVQLSLIAKKVSNYDLTKQGLQELYDFKQQHPNIDIEAGFRNVPPYFLDYINRSLQDIEQDRRKGITHSDSNLKWSGERMTAKDHIEHIRTLRAKFGLPVESTSQEKSDTKVLSTNTNEMNRADKLDGNKNELGPPSAKGVDLESSNVVTSASNMLPPRPATTSKMEALKQRLEKIKREASKRT